MEGNTKFLSLPIEIKQASKVLSKTLMIMFILGTLHLKLLHIVLNTPLSWSGVAQLELMLPHSNSNMDLTLASGAIHEVSHSPQGYAASSHIAKWY